VNTDLWYISTCSICFSNSGVSLALQCLEMVFKRPRQYCTHHHVLSADEIQLSVVRYHNADTVVKFCSNVRMYFILQPLLIY